MINSLLEGNKKFVADEFEKNIEYYHTIAGTQSPQVLWIGCSDSRVSEDVITNSKPGTMFVHRNVANIVSFNDVNIAALMEFAIIHLKIPDIIICGHTRCGGIRAIEMGVRENYIADWLLISGNAKEEVDRIATKLRLTLDQKLDLLAEENVRLQIKHLLALSFIRNQHAEGDLPRVHGWIYDVNTGHIKVVVDGMKKEGRALFPHPLPRPAEPT